MTAEKGSLRERKRLARFSRKKQVDVSLTRVFAIFWANTITHRNIQQITPRTSTDALCTPLNDIARTGIFVWSQEVMEKLESHMTGTG